MPEKTRNRFRSVFPSLDQKQGAEFRQITIELLNEINSKVLYTCAFTYTLS